MPVRITPLEARDDARGSSFGVPLPFATSAECHVATLRPGHVRGNHFHREGRELLVVIHRDRWSLYWDDGEKTPVQTRAFEGAGAVEIAIDAPCAHAVRNDGAAELQLVSLSDTQPETQRRWLVDPAPRIAGVDGCRNGWIAVVKDADGIQARIVGAPSELHALFDQCAIVAIDIPIGLAESGPRACDHHARRHLPGHASSVFPAPIRKILHLDDFAKAREICAVTKQTVAIMKKVREVDHLLQTHHELRGRVFEVHPEVSFATWNRSDPIEHSKHSLEGQEARRQLVAAHFGEEALDAALAATHKRAKLDDVLDAFAALWTAERIANNQHGTLGDGRADATGLLMRIVY
jgi:predicted RNase H-like nuclease